MFPANWERVQPLPSPCPCNLLKNQRRN